MDEIKKIPDHAKRVFQGVIFDIYQWEQELFDGSTTIFEKAKRQGSTSVIAVLPNKKILIVEDEQPSRRTMITFPGGRIDAGETPEEASHRELLEETGYVVDELTLYRMSQPVSKIDWPLYLFIGRNARKVQEPNPGPGERITLKEITVDELIALAEHPRFQNVEMTINLIKARYDAEARATLEKALFGE